MIFVPESGYSFLEVYSLYLLVYAQFQFRYFITKPGKQ